MSGGGALNSDGVGPGDPGTISETTSPFLVGKDGKVFTPSRRDPLFIVAPSYREATYAARELGLSVMEWRRVLTDRDLLGRRDLVVLYYWGSGSWDFSTLQDVRDCLRRLAACGGLRSVRAVGLR